MRLPWLSVDNEGLTKGRLLGRLLKTSEERGIGMAMMLWHWALENSPDGDFSGAVRGDAELLASAIGWPTENTAALLVELQRVGLIATTPELRVRGLDRYRKAWEKNRRKGHTRDNQPKTHEHPRGSERENGGTRADQTRQTQTQTQLEDFPPPKPKRERKLSDAEQFFAWLAATRASKTPLSDEPLSARGINAAFGRALSANGRPTLEKCYLAFLDEPDGASKEPPWPWRSFLARLPSLRLRPAATPKSKFLGESARQDLYGETA